MATSNGRIYFREGHFGDYDPLYGWYSAPDGEDKYSYAMIAEAIIGVKNKDSVTVNPVGSMLYFGTYYADKRTVGEGRTSTQYSMDYYRYDYP